MRPARACPPPRGRTFFAVPAQFPLERGAKMGYNKGNQSSARQAERVRDMFGLQAVGTEYPSAYASGYLSRAARSTAAVTPVSRAQTVPVSPVSAVVSVQRDAAQAAQAVQQGPQLPLQREGVDPAELAVRSRIQYLNPADAPAAGTAMPEAAAALAGQTGAAAPRAAQAAAEPGGQQAQAGQAAEETKSAQEVMEEGECQTCKERKYQDQSDDPGVSYQTPTNIAPEQAAAAVRGHEQEHVTREQAQAQRDGRDVVSQSVTLHTAICPECGKVYVSGGTTRTTTRAAQTAERYQQPEQTPSAFQSVA